MRPTIVTALLDIGRGAMDRHFEYYKRSFRRLAEIENPLVVYASVRDADWIYEVRQNRDIVVRLFEPDDLRTMPYFEAIDTIRLSPDWVSGAAWMRESPQYKLPEYTPLTMMKPYWMQEVARENPFGTDHLYWLDAGIFSNRMYGCMGRWVAADVLPRGRFLVFMVPYRADIEANGMPIEAFCEHLGVPQLRWWARGGLIGGRLSLIEPFVEHFDEVLALTLEQGLLGTEENILTIQAHQHPDRFNTQRLWLHRWSLGVSARAFMTGRLKAL